MDVNFDKIRELADLAIEKNLAEVTVQDGERSVTIKRDSYGTPHIYADSTYGLFYGYAYAVATDRLYQLEIAKRSGWGTVAEVLGADFLELDKVTHNNIDPDSIRKQLAALSKEDRAMFEGYAAGFTQRVREVKAQRDTLMPKEFLDKGFEPSEWQPEDIAMVWVGLILNRFFAGTAEVANLNLLETLKADQGAERGEQLYKQLRWLNDPTAPTIIAQPEAKTALADLPTQLQALSSQAAQDYLHKQAVALGPTVAAGTPTAWTRATGLDATAPSSASSRCRRVRCRRTRAAARCSGVKGGSATDGHLGVGRNGRGCAEPSDSCATWATRSGESPGSTPEDP